MSNIFEKLKEDATRFACSDEHQPQHRHIIYRDKFNELIVDEILSLQNMFGFVSVSKIKRHFDI